MKLNYQTFKPALVLSALMLSIFLSTPVFGQISINSDDMPEPGDTIRKSNAFTTGEIDYTLTGENYNWDFTSLFPLFQTVDTFASVTSVPFLYQVFFIPNFVANLAQKFPEIDTLGIPLTEPYRFFKNSNGAFTDVGFAVTINDFIIPLKFDDADVVYDFPVEYANIDSSFSGVNFGIPELGFIGIDRKRVNKVDGWGTLTTSYGTFDVLRMKSMVEETDSVYIDSVGFGTAINRVYTEYKWLSPGFHAPVLQVTEEGPLLTVAWMDYVVDPFTAISDPTTSSASLSIIPNPVSSEGHILIEQDKPGNVLVSLFDLTGNRLMDLFNGYKPQGQSRIELGPAMQKLNSGMYFIRMKNSDGVNTRKLIIR